MVIQFKILVVEDAKIYQEAYKAMLSEQKFIVQICQEGSCLKQAAQAFKPDVILMDIYLPDANGIELTREIVKNPQTKNIPVIVVTGSDDIEAQQAAYMAGAREFINKPVNKMQLLVRLENVLRFKAQQEEMERLIQDNTVSEMGASIAHHFNQPLTTLLGASQMLQMKRKEYQDDQELMELIDLMVEAGEKIAEMVKNVERLKNYKAKHYLKDINIVDLEN